VRIISFTFIVSLPIENDDEKLLRLDFPLVDLGQMERSAFRELSQFYLGHQAYALVVND